MKSVGIIGTGRLGTQIAEELIRGSDIETLYLWNRSLPKLEGNILSLNIWASLVERQVSIEALNFDQLDSIDLLILAIKERYDARELMLNATLPVWLPRDFRYIGLLQDLPTLVDVAAHLRSFTGRLLVLSNPVDVVASLMSRWLPKASVVGGGLSVDSARLRFGLGLEGRYQQLTVPVAGEHGSFFPVKSMSRELATLPANDLRRAVTAAQEVGIEIFRDLGYTLHDCAYAFASDALWLSGERDVRLAFFSVPRGDAYVGQPCWMQAGRIVPVVLSDEENSLLDEHVSRIRAVTDCARMEGARLRRFRRRRSA